jgi:endonuclease/exonuclease/phosphatase family metal-dependent hydrolase
MKILTWNLNHRIREKTIPLHLAKAIASLNPDIIVLTEYVSGSSRKRFKEELSDIGLSYMCESDFTPKQNQVFIASRYPIQKGNIHTPAIDEAFPSNVLHVSIADEGFDILGIRIPDYSKYPKIKRACWDWILSIASSVKDCPFILIGDFNTDPIYPKARCGDRIGRLIDDGWQHVSSGTEASYWTPKGHGVCIDHAFVTQHFIIQDARYVREESGYLFAGRGKAALSDHATLIVDISH